MVTSARQRSTLLLHHKRSGRRRTELTVRAHRSLLFLLYSLHVWTCRILSFLLYLQHSSLITHTPQCIRCLICTLSTHRQTGFLGLSELYNHTPKIPSGIANSRCQFQTSFERLGRALHCRVDNRGKPSRQMRTTTIARELWKHSANVPFWHVVHHCSKVTS